MDFNFSAKVEMPQTGIHGLESRREQMAWLRANMGERGERWTFMFRPKGGRTFYFRDVDDTLWFKLIHL